MPIYAVFRRNRESIRSRMILPATSAPFWREIAPMIAWTAPLRTTRTPDASRLSGYRGQYTAMIVAAWGKSHQSRFPPYHPVQTDIGSKPSDTVQVDQVLW
jgi:hypothetical protein